jgi:hypothetical protein
MIWSTKTTRSKMLQGIKTGKKKKKPAADGSFFRNPDSLEAAAVDTSHAHRRSNNQSIAEQLKQSLAANKAPPVIPLKAGSNLEQRGRIQADLLRSNDDDSTAKQTITLYDHCHQPQLAAAAAASKKDDSEWTIQEMHLQEKSITMSYADLEARSTMRVLKRQKVKANKNCDSDEDDRLQTQRSAQLFSHATKISTQQDSSARKQQALQKDDRQSKLIQKCWWWLESSSFQRHQLLSLGDYVRLQMAPHHLSVRPNEHFYIVPLQHAESLAHCEANAWDEIRRFQTSLTELFATQNKGFIFFETVLPNSNFWQTKLEAVAVPLRAFHDAPLCFTSALQEQAQDHGVHQKLMKTSATKPLSSIVPKGFSYIYVEYTKQEGYVQMIETNDFPQDFAADTISSMLGDDPIRFRRKQKVGNDEERQGILSFLKEWEKVDWTLKLD